ncbi:unnamed protein product [Phytophthora fragariaefolia]|uniref:Unnamed protein product n=1 Tax=Phytophthora fragariaefolia TaxID=1490495 RepID=A0A9W6UBR0_9STRA|nr:unnamed protein product [Phytophthora fragariaefolia]
MAPPSTSTGTSEDSPSRPSLAGAAEFSAPSSSFTASTGDASGAGSESSSTRPGDALGSVLGAVPRSAADAPEASFVAPGVPRFSSVRWEDIADMVTAGTDRTVRQVQRSTQSQFLALARLMVDLNRWPPLRADYELDQRLEAAGSLSDVVDALAPVPRSPAHWEYELTELRGDVASLEARLATSEASLRREVDLRLKSERFSQAAVVLEQRCRRLDKSLADTHKVIRHDREEFKAGISSYAAQLRQLREYLEQSDRQSSASGGSISASASAMPAAFPTFLEELGALQLAIPAPPTASGSSEGSGPTPPASSGSLGGAAAKSGSLTSLTIDSDNSDDSGPIIPSALHKGKGKRPAKSSAKHRSAPPTPKKKQRLGRSSVDLKARKAAKQVASVVVSSSGPPQGVPSSLPAASLSTSSAPISGIAVSADSDVLSFASIPSGSDPLFFPIPLTPASPASSTASTASLPSTPVVSRGITPGTEASVPVEIGDDGVSGEDGAASEASAAPGGVFSFPVVSQPRRDGRPTRAASTTAGFRSMAAAENEAAPDTLVLGLTAFSNTPTTTQASVERSTSTPDPAESAAVVAAASAAIVTSASARRRVASTRTGPVLPARAAATPAPRQASASRARTVVTATLSTMPGTRSTAFEPVTAIPGPVQGPQPRVRASRKLPDLANPLLEPAFTAPGAQEAWCEILSARIPQPIASDRVTECSIAGIQAFADGEGPLHPWQRLRARLPESPCTFGANDFMPDKPISIRASGLAIVVELWRQFTGRAVGRTEHSDLVFALWERAHWISVAAVEQWLQQLSDRIGSDTPEYLETEAAWRAYNKARNLRADRLRLQVPKRFWVWCTPDAGGKIKCPPEILLEPSMLQYSFETLTWAPSTAAWTAEVVDMDARQHWRNCWMGLPAEHPFNTMFVPCNPSVPLFVPEGSTREEAGAAIVVNPALRQSHVTAPWVEAFSDARTQAAADASAAADSPSDASSARTRIPAADQADVQAELGATAPALARLDVLADLATTAEI